MCRAELKLVEFSWKQSVKADDAQLRMFRVFVIRQKWRFLLLPANFHKKEFQRNFDASRKERLLIAVKNNPDMWRMQTKTLQ